MSRILGLDLGTNSIGWAVVEEDNNQFNLTDQGARIFSEGVKIEKGNESSRAAERTDFRSARKIKFRRKLRKYETLKVLSKNDMCPLKPKEVEKWRKSGFKKYPLNEKFLNWLKTDDEKNINPYYFRDKASKQKIEKYELGRAFYHIAQRRGFLSNRLDQSAEGIIEQHKPNLEELIESAENFDDLKNELKNYFEELDILNRKSKDLDEGEKKLKTLYNAFKKIIDKNITDFAKAKETVAERLNKKEYLGAVKRGIREIDQAIEDGGFQTLGQYFYSLYNQQEEVKNKTTGGKEKFHRAKIRNHYTSREDHYLAEFEFICEQQGIAEIDKKEQIPEKRYSGLAKRLYNAIFFQRPLKSQKGLIGKCTFEKNKARCAVSHPDFEEYRMWAYLNTIKIKTPGDKELRFLEEGEKQKMIPKFYRKRNTFDFGDLAKTLIPKEAKFAFHKSSKAKGAHYLFNYRLKDTVSGCPVSTSLKNIFGENWKKRKFTYQTKNAERKEEERNVDYHDLWHLLQDPTWTSKAYLENYAREKLGLTDKQAKTFSKIQLKKDFAKLSLNAIRKILPYLKKGLLYSHAVFMANIEKVVDAEIWENEEQRKKIQHKTGEIIDQYGFENGLLYVANSLLKECFEEDKFYSKEAENLYRKDLREKLIPFFKQHKIEDEEKEKIVNELFPVFIEQMNERKFIVIKRLDEKVVDFLKGENEDGVIYCSDKKRLKKLYHPSDIAVFKKKYAEDENGDKKLVLGSPLTTSIKNPMAMRALHQLRKVLNTLILEGQIDEKTKIHIELARDLNDANKRKAIHDFQNENKEKRKKYREKLKSDYKEETGKDIEPTEDDLLRYQLWVEQNKQEIYEPSINGGKSKSIGISKIVGKDPEYDIEHTMPRGDSQDNSLMNKTLCSKTFNREVKKKKMPVELTNYEFILSFIEHWKKEAEKLDDEINLALKATKTAATKEAKDKQIRKRHLLTLKRNYLQGKYDRFVWIEPKKGFKNSQIPDTGIITKYARAYLKSYFDKVYSVKGGMVSEFRKVWGLQESYIENGKKYYEKKDRSKHTHHTIDAITIACMTKNKYNAMAEAWQLQDNEKIKLARKKLEASKPWKTFKEDLEDMENKILISHYLDDNMPLQTKKILRERGKKQYVAEVEKDKNGKTVPKTDLNGKIIYKLDENGNRMPRYQQGDTVRGSLHQDSIYGKIKNPVDQKQIKYVIRKPLENINKNEVKNIVDDEVKRKVEEAIDQKILVITPNAQQANKMNGVVWRNKEKGVPIKKVRLFTRLKNALELKKQPEQNKLTEKAKRKSHKHNVYAVNDENYCMAIYEERDKKGKLKRDFELVNNMDAGEYYKKSNTTDDEMVPLYHVKSKLPLKYKVRKGDLVLFYKENIEELKELENNDLTNRLYRVIGFEGDGRIQFRHHQTALQQSSKNKDEATIVKFMADNNLKNSQVNYEKPVPWLRLTKNNLNFLLNKKEFEISPTAKVKFL